MQYSPPSHVNCSHGSSVTDSIEIYLGKQWRIYRGTPPTAQQFLNFMRFFWKFGKIVCWRPPYEGRHPLLRGILDPPLERKSVK